MSEEIKPEEAIKRHKKAYLKGVAAESALLGADKDQVAARVEYLGNLYDSRQEKAASTREAIVAE